LLRAALGVPLAGVWDAAAAACGVLGAAEAAGGVVFGLFDELHAVQSTRAQSVAEQASLSKTVVTSA